MKAEGTNGRRRAYVETYGCQMNISDGELMEGVLAAEGYEIVSTPEEADVVLVNTCAIREHAERRVLGRVGQLRELKLDDPDVILGVTGCMAQRMGEDLLLKAPYVDLVMGPDGYRGLADRVAEIRGERPRSTDGAAADPGERAASGSSRLPSDGERGPGGDGSGRRRLAVLDMDLDENYEGLEQRRSSDVAAWVPIQRGCDHRCTFCIVPYVRGPEKNRKAEEILSEVRGIAESGVTEVTLLGQTVNSYVRDGWSFADLLRAVARVDGIRRVRFTSPHPNDVTREMLEVMAGEPAVCEQLHLPLQSGNDTVLKRMLRRYTVDEFLEKVELARSIVPDLALSTDVIVGFPGEDEDAFRDTLAVMERVRFDDAFTYRYSPRDGTPATRMPDDWIVDDSVAQDRLERLIETHRRIQEEISAAELGRVEEILVEREAKHPGQVLGKTRRNKAVHLPGGEELIGCYRTVRLTETTGATFVGEVVETRESGIAREAQEVREAREVREADESVKAGMADGRPPEGESHGRRRNQREPARTP
ncbi:MAG: MiaB/RimO family radical SAM methylthiotransferase [Gemmatimonadota bacterium]